VVTVSLNFDFHLLPGLNWPTFAAVLRVKISLIPGMVLLLNGLIFRELMKLKQSKKSTQNNTQFGNKASN